MPKEISCSSESSGVSEEYRLCISSPPDREHLVAEIFFGDQQWAELNQEGSELALEVYPRQDGKPWQLSFEVVTFALADARRRLLGD